MSDLGSILDFYLIESRNARAGSKVVEAIYDMCERAASNPATGRGHPELGPGLRSKLVQGYPYRVYYRSVEGSTQILRVLHQRRNVKPMLF